MGKEPGEACLILQVLRVNSCHAILSFLESVFFLFVESVFFLFVKSVFVSSVSVDPPILFEISPRFHPVVVFLFVFCSSPLFIWTSVVH